MPVIVTRPEAVSGRKVLYTYVQDPIGNLSSGLALRSLRFCFGLSSLGSNSVYHSVLDHQEKLCLKASRRVAVGG